MIIDTSWKVRIKENPYMFGKDMYIFRYVSGGIEVLKKDGIIERFPEGAAIPQEPFMHLEQDMLQSLADALNDNGIKPQQGFIEGKLQATENHLQDMRTLLKLK